jgi:DegV family protein with EDD domain
MAGLVIVTDSTACVPQDKVEHYRIKVVPSAIILYDGVEYIEGETLSVSEAYELIIKDPDKFSTTAIPPGMFLDRYRKLVKEANSILHISISSQLSANFKTASMAADMLMKEYPGVKIRVLDSRTVSGPETLIVLSAAEAAKRGMSFDKVAEVAEEAGGKAKGLMMLDTLRYVYRTGRMSKLSSRIVSVFNIKPINKMTPEGSLQFVDKVRKREDGYRRLIELIKQEAGTGPLHFVVSHAAAPDIAERFIGLLKEEIKCSSVLVSEFSAVMGYGAGPGCLFVGFHPESELLKA